MKENALIKIKPLLRATSFTSTDARLLGISSASLAYYVKLHAIQRIGHGIYRGTDAPVCNDFRFEDLVLAIQKVHGGVICLISALTLYDLTEEMTRQHWIAIPNSTRHRGTPDIKIVRMRNIKLGVTSIKIGKVPCPIFDRERTIIDSFRYLSKETALKALKLGLEKKGREKIDLEKIQKYAKTLHVKIEPYLLAMTV